MSLFAARPAFAIALALLVAAPLAARADQPPDGQKKAEAPAALLPAARLVESAKRVFLAMEREFLRGLRAPEDLYQWSRRWRDAEIAAASERVLSVAAEKAVAAGYDHRQSAVKEHLERMKKLAEVLELKVKTGAARPSELLAAKYYLAEAERAATVEMGPR